MIDPKSPPPQEERLIRTMENIESDLRKVVFTQALMNVLLIVITVELFLRLIGVGR